MNKNVLAVLNVIQQKNSTSRSEIARITKLTPATISNIIEKLMDLNIVRFVGPGSSRGGRRPILIEFHPDAFYLSGVDLGVTKIIAVVTDLHGKIISRAKLDINPNNDRKTIISKMLAATNRSFSETKDHIRKKIIGIGLSIPGLLDIKNGISKFAPNLPDWREVPIVEIYEKEFSLPSFIINDARAMALGEARYGAGRNFNNFICINVGHGIGSGIIIDGELYHGSHYTAGEFGHMTIIPSGPLCHCGNRGCLEAIASGYAIAASAIRAVNTGASIQIKNLVDGRIEKITTEIVAESAQMGDITAQELLREAGRYIGIGIANVINLLNPEIIIIGGGVAKAGDFFFDEIKNTIKKRAFTTMIKFPDIVPCILGDEASSLGAAALVFEKIIEKEEIIKI